MRVLAGLAVFLSSLLSGLGAAAPDGGRMDTAKIAAKALPRPPFRPDWDPPDPSESGPCNLVLRAIDGDRYRPIQIPIQIWRLNAPGNHEWTEGDQWQTSVKLRPEGTRIEGLPAGEYRAYCLFQRAGTNDPIAFHVGGDLTKHTLVVPMPRKHKVFVRVYDEKGRLLDWKEHGAYGPGRSLNGRYGPRWRKGRRRVNPARNGGVGLRSYTRCARISRRPGPPRAAPQPILVGEFEDDDKRGPAWSRIVCRFDGDRTPVEFIHYHRPGPDRTYAVLSVPMAPIREAVLLPDGRRALEAGATLRVRCEPLVVTKATPADAWRTIPLSVTVWLYGYEPLRFDYGLGKKLTPRVMRPKKA